MKRNLFSTTAFFAPTIAWDTPTEGAPATPAAEPTPAATPTPSAITGAPKADEAPASVDAAGNPVEAVDDPAPAPLPTTFEDLVLPVGYEIPEASREGLLALLNDPELSRTDLANKLIEMQGAMAGDPAANLAAQLETLNTTQQDEWRTALTALPNFGGAALDQNLAEVKQGMEFAGAGKEVFDALDLTGAGNHPALVPLLHKLVKPYLEAAPTTTDPAQGKLTREQKMFPNQS